MNKEHIRIKLALLCWLCLAGIASAQVDYFGLEVFVFNYDESDVTIEDQAQSTVWDSSRNITSRFQSGGFTMPALYTLEDSVRAYGFNHETSNAYPCVGCVDAKRDSLGYGLYEISGLSTIFYLDLRDANMASPIDIDLKYDEDGIWWKATDSGNCGPDTWQQINEDATLTIWDMWACADWTEGSPNTAPFQPTDPTNLNGSVSNNHPLLNWTASTDPPWTTIEYKVWRSISGGVPDWYGTRLGKSALLL